MNNPLIIHQDKLFEVQEISEGCYIKKWYEPPRIDVASQLAYYFNLRWIETDIQQDHIDIQTFLQYGERVDKSDNLLLIDQFDKASSVILYGNSKGYYFRFFKYQSGDGEIARVAEKKNNILNWKPIAVSNEKKYLSPEEYRNIKLLNTLPNMIIGRSYMTCEKDGMVFRKWAGSKKAEMLVDDNWIYIDGPIPHTNIQINI